MTPSYTIDNLSNRMGINFEFYAQGSFGMPLFKTLTNYFHVMLGQFRIGISYAFCLAISALCDHVVNVVGVGTKPKMGRVNAGWIVAFVADFCDFRNRPVMQLPTKASRQNVARPSSADTYLSVAKWTSSASPRPTLFWSAFGNFFPESFSEWLATIVSTNESALLTWEFSSLKGLPTTALAKYGGWFVRGMLGHVNSSFQLLTTPPSDSRRCGGNFIGSFQSIVPQMNEVNQ